MHISQICILGVDFRKLVVYNITCKPTVCGYTNRYIRIFMPMYEVTSARIEVKGGLSHEYI